MSRYYQIQDTIQILFKAFYNLREELSVYNAVVLKDQNNGSREAEPQGD